MLSIQSLLLGGVDRNDRKLAEALGCAPSTVGRYRKRPDIIPWGVIQKLAKIRGYRIKFERIERRYEY